MRTCGQSTSPGQLNQVARGGRRALKVKSEGKRLMVGVESAGKSTM